MSGRNHTQNLSLTPVMDNVDKLFKWDLLQTKITEQLADVQERISAQQAVLDRAHEQDDTATAMKTATQMLLAEGERITLVDLQNWMAGEVFPKPE